MTDLLFRGREVKDDFIMDYRVDKEGKIRKANRFAGGSLIIDEVS